jgi:ABC-2 type transport system ATP-binding protein
MTSSPSQSDLAIDLSHVSKVYRGRVHALQGIEMKVRRGEVFGLLGPNGAGKSTLVKIIMTVIRATRADGTVLGKPVGSKAALAKVGYLPENHRFPRYLTGREVLHFFGALSGIPRGQRKKRADELLDVVGMTDWADRKVSLYSKGMMQRVGLAQSLINDPDLVLLDEPTDGVDPIGRRDIRDVLTRLRDEGKTVFINSHLLSELEQVCDRLAIILYGQVAKQGSMEDLSIAKQRYEVDVLGTIDMSELALLPFGIQSAQQNGTQTLRIDTTDALAVQSVIDELRQRGRTIQRVQLMRPTLEELFMEVVASSQGGQRVSPGARTAPIPPQGFPLP